MEKIIDLINTIINCNDNRKIFVVLFIGLFFLLVYNSEYLFESDLNMILLQNKEVEMSNLITYIFFYLVYVISNYYLIRSDVCIETVIFFILYSVYNMLKYIILRLKKKESCKDLLFREEIMFVIVMPIILFGFVDNNNDYLLIVLIGAAVQSFISIMIIKTQKKQTIFIYNNKSEKLYFYYKKNEYIVCGTNKNIKDVDNIKIISICDFIQGKYFLSYKDIEDTTPNIEKKNERK